MRTATLNKLKALHAADPRQYRNRLLEHLGMGHDDAGKPFRIATPELNPRHFSFQEVTRDLLGEDAARNPRRISEAAVGPSNAIEINMWSDTVAGLLGAIAFEGYNSPQFIRESMCTVRPVLMNGGYALGYTMKAGEVTGDIPVPMPLPDAAPGSTKLHLPERKRQGFSIQLTDEYIRADIIGGAQENAFKIGENLAYLLELQSADCVLGITNTYERDGITGNTYLATKGSGVATNGTVPMNYKNAEDNDLATWEDIDQARLILQGNTDPSNGREIYIPLEGSVLLVPPAKEMATKMLVGAVFIRRTAGNDMYQSAMPMPALSVLSNFIWQNRLAASSLSANAADMWYWGNFKKAFAYLEYLPFTTIPGALDFADRISGIVFQLGVEARGVMATMEPRYVYRNNSA